MVEELPPNRQQNNNETVDNPTIDFRPESTRLDTPSWPANQREEESRRDILNRYQTQDTASPYLPLVRDQLNRQDGRFDNLSRGSRMFSTAESVTIYGAPPGEVYGDSGGSGARIRGPQNRADLRDMVADAQPSIADVLSTLRTGKPEEVNDLRSLITNAGRNGTRDNATRSGDRQDKPANGKNASDEIDIFAQIRERSTPRPDARVDGRTEVRAEAQAEPLPQDINVTYPNNKGVLVGKRDKDGNLTEFTIKDKNGGSSFHKDEAGRWIKTDGMGFESVVNGSFDVNRDNELVYKTPNGEVHVHKADGSISKGRILQDGSTVTLDDSGKKPVALNRKDGSKVECEYDKDNLSKVVETDKTGNNRVTWTKNENGIWKSKSETKDLEGNWKDAGKPSAERRNLELNVNGRYSYEDQHQFKHVLNGDGTERIEPKVTVNKDGTKTVEIQYPEGKGFRTITLDKDNKVTKFTEQDEEGKRTYIKDKQGDWYLKAGLRNVKVGGDFQLLKNGDFVSKDGDRYDIQRLDGSVIHEKVNANGSRIRYNDDNSVSKLTRKDESVVEVKYNDKGEKTQIIDTNKDENARTVWTKNDKGTWTSESQKKDSDGKWVADGKKSEERKNIDINGQGMTIATDMRGFKHVIGPDGQRLNEGANGSKFTFDDKGRLESITYNGQTGRQNKFKYDDKDNLIGVELINNKTGQKLTYNKVSEGVWDVTDSKTGTKQQWKGDMKVSPEGNFMVATAEEKAKGEWRVTTPGYDKYTEKLSSDGKHATRRYPDGRIVESDKIGDGEERVTKITNGKESREFRYDSNGKLSECIDTTSKGTSSWKPETDKVKIYPDGSVAYEKKDGSAVMKTGDFRTTEVDKDGNMTKVTTKDGATRSFDYETINGKQELVRITSVTPGKNGDKTEVLNRKKNSDGSVSDQFVSVGAGGKEKVVAGVRLLDNGDYKYNGSDGKERIAKIGKTTDQGGFSENVDEARERLMESMEAHLDEPRRQRLQQMMARFEQRGKERVEAQTAGGMSAEQAQAEWDKKIAATYDHLAHMVTSNESGATYDVATRAKLVENAVFSMAWPVKANDQGNWGCCWQISGVYLGVIQHPDKMAKMLDELSTKGTFTDTNGKTWTPPKNLLSFTDQGGDWTIENCGNGRRSPCSEIWTSVAAYLSQDGRRMDRGASGGTMEGCMHSMQLITGDTWKGTKQSQMTQKQYQQDLLLKGGVILFSPGHMYLGTLEKNNGQWQVVSSLQHGDQGRHLNGVVTDLKNWTVTGGGRQQYKPDIPPSLPKCNDKGVGPNQPNRPNGPNRYRDNPQYPDYPNYPNTPNFPVWVPRRARFR